jgi:hypothetical protein
VLSAKVGRREAAFLMQNPEEKERRSQGAGRWKSRSQNSEVRIQKVKFCTYVHRAAILNFEF